MDDLDDIRQAAEDLAKAQQRRDDAIIAAIRGQRRSQAEVARAADLTRQRISQILQGEGLRPERAFLGDGPLTAIVGQKREDRKGAPVIAQETVVAEKRLTALAGSYHLDVETDVIPPPGIVDLNRKNLIILAGPRLFPLVGMILDSDPVLRFHRNAAGVWFIQDHDTGKVYRSGRDDGVSRDFGYLGRLPRPDGQGTFLVAAGIHAIGTQGVIAWLETSVAGLYEETRARRFSTLIGCDYDPGTLKVTAASRVSPVYKGN